MYKYDTHLHTYPVSKCATHSIEDNLNYYKKLGYDGIFITNHFINGNINIDKNLPYEEKVNFYFSDYEKALEYGMEIGLRVFLGVEMSYGGTDFLIYGLDKEWYLSNPQIMEMKMSDMLKLLMENGALVVQAHPYREAAYIDHIRLFPRCIHGVEVINACGNDLSNKMADIYADNYELKKIAGSDNHHGDKKRDLAGVCFDTPLSDEADFIDRVMNNEVQLFTIDEEGKETIIQIWK